MFWPHPPIKPILPSVTITKVIAHKEKGYDHLALPNFEKIFADLEVPPEDHKYVTMQVWWSRPDFPAPHQPLGIKAVYYKTEQAPNPFYDIEYKEYLEKQKEYYKKTIEHRNQIALFEQTEKTYYEERINQIKRKVNEINKELTNLEYEGLGA